MLRMRRAGERRRALDIRDIMGKALAEGTTEGVVKAPAPTLTDKHRRLLADPTRDEALRAAMVDEAAAVMAAAKALQRDTADMSMAELWARMPDAERERLIDELDPADWRALLHDWAFWARPNQLAPRAFADGLTFGWLLNAGRGFGKTRVGAEQVKDWVEGMPPGHTEHLRIALVAETAADARDVMVRGNSGILAVSRPEFTPTYVPTRRLLRWPCGCMAHTYSGEKPGQLRGPQHHKAWVDELAKYRYAEETMDNLEFGLRLGANPQAVITTTPRPTPMIRTLVRDPQFSVTHGTSYENIANLALPYIVRVLAKYEGTRQGRQELRAELLSEIEGALWTLQMLERNRVGPKSVPELVRVVVAVDPQAKKSQEQQRKAVDAQDYQAETGIIVAGLGVNGHGYLFRDLSDAAAPAEWAKRAVAALKRYGADRIVGEVNNGGDMVEATIRTVDVNVPYKSVWASRGKAARAEPVAALGEQGKIHHVGTFAELEDQLVNFTPDGYVGAGSPDRADAYVWAFTELMLARQADRDPKNWKVVHG